MKFTCRKHCPLCGSENSKIIFSDSYGSEKMLEFLLGCYGSRDFSMIKNEIYELLSCQKCGFIWQCYVMDPDSSELYYNSWTEPEKSLKKRKNAPVSLFENYASQAARIARIFNKKPTELTILDFGMGWGYWALMCHAFGYNTFGCELSSLRIEHASNLGIKVISDMNILAKHQFDFINCEQVFEHVEDPAALIKTLSNTLKKGGVIRIAVPDSKNVLNEIQSGTFCYSKGASQPIEHINSFTRKTLLKLGYDAGLQQMIPIIKPHMNIEFFKTSAVLLYRRFYGTTVYFKK